MPSSDLRKRSRPEDSLRPESSVGVRDSMASGTEVWATPAGTPTVLSRPLSSYHDPRPESAYMLPLPNSTVATPLSAVQQLPPDIGPEPNPATTTSRTTPTDISPSTPLPSSSRPDSTIDPNTITPLLFASDLRPPSAPLLRDSTALGSTANQSFSSTQPPAAALPYNPTTSAQDSAVIQDKEKGVVGFPVSGAAGGRRPWSRVRKLFLVADVLAIIVILAVVIVAPITLRSKRGGGTSSASSSADGGSGFEGGPTSGGGPTTGDGGGPVSASIVIGRDGSTVKTETGDSFIYTNKFGGFWVQDSKDPYNDAAQAQSWSPPLSQQWDYQKDIIRGVNLGGWFVPEPFICPALFEPYVNGTIVAKDEWTLSQAMAADTANGGLKQLEKHYQTFITEEDFAQIAGAGLNWIRLPIPFWAVQKYPNEPFLEGVCWKYIVKAFQWARKYGLRINLDLHAVPGSQNGYNHSGKGGGINFMYGAMGFANAQRTLDYLRVIVEFISQPEWTNVVTMISVMNEPSAAQMGVDQLTSFYLQLHDTLRNITGTGAGHGPFITIHDGFVGATRWVDFLPGHDRVALDLHPYLIFVGQIDESPLSAQILRPCNWASGMNNSWSNFGVTVAGEWSNAINDCGLYLNAVGRGSRWDGDLDGGPNTRGTGPNSCADWNDWANWSTDRKADMAKFALASMDALQQWFFWTWKIGASSVTGKVESPMWSYQLGLQNGWMPLDPRDSVGVCGGKSPASALKPSMIGGAGGTGTIPPVVRAANPWPPITMNPNNLAGASLPTYTPTGAIVRLPAPTGGGGWFDAEDTRPMYTPVAGCTYPDPWNAGNAIPPACTGPAAKRLVSPPRPKRTPPPI